MQWKDALISIWQESEVVKSIPAHGRSMYPLIKHGDTLDIKFCGPESIRIGDIVAFRRGETTIVHRIIKKTDTGFLEKGDLQLRAQPVKLERIMGKVVMNFAGAKICNSLMSALGYVIHILSPVKPLAKLLLLIPYIINAGTRAITKLR